MRLGIVGAGAVAALHATSAGVLDGLELGAVCDLSSETASLVADPWGAAVYTDYRDMFANGQVDAVIINTPHSLHKEMALAAAAHGIHVLVEKPMAISVADCEEMEQAFAEAGVVVVVGQIQHFMAEKLAALEAISAGRMGQVLAIHDQRSTDYRPGTRPPWFFDKEIAGGGALMNIGAHCLDRTVWLGGAFAETISATTLHRFSSPVETDGAISLKLRNGVQVRIAVVSDTPRHLDELVIICEKGTLTVDPRVGTFEEVDGVCTQLHKSGPDDIQNAFTAQLADFAGAIAGTAPKVSGPHAKHVVELVLAAYQSAETGRVVQLDT